MLRTLVPSRRMVTFGVIGAFVFAVGLALQTALQKAGMGVVEAYTIQLFVTLVMNYDLNRMLTWRDRSRDTFTTIKFFVGRVLVLALCWKLFEVLTRFEVNYVAASAVTVILGMGINYFFGDRLTFVDSTPWAARMGAKAPERAQAAFAKIVSNDAVWPKYLRYAKWAALAALVVFLLVRFNAVTLPWILLAVLVLSSCQALFQIYWRTYTNQNPENRDARRFPEPRQDATDHVSISILAPAKAEETVIGATLRQLVKQDYPHSKMQVLPTLRHDQLPTIAEAQKVEALAPELITVHVNRFLDTEKKSAQMNRMLPLVTGEYVSMVDAESIMATRLLSHVDALIRETDADVVIAPVQLTNLDTSTEGSWLKRTLHYARSGWFAVHNVLEYRFWFSGQMFYQQDLGFVPLPGNSVFIRTSLLKKAGGWNDDRLTEDADLGLRLCADHDAKIVAAYDPELATREHTPSFIFGDGGMFRQRRRWDQGFWQILRDGYWLRLKTIKQRFMAGYILATPLLQAVNGFMLIPAVAAAVWLKMPVPLTLALFAPLLMNGFLMLNQLFELRDFGREMDVAPKLRHYVSLIVGFMPYQVILGLAAIDSVRREAAGITAWDGTGRNAAIHASSISTLLTNE